MDESSRVVKETDFRKPEYMHANVADYEFRKDGKLVRKDRWETAVRSIAYHVGFGSRIEWEIEEVILKVKELVAGSSELGDEDEDE